MADLTAQAYSQGVEITLAAASELGDSVAWASRQKLLVLNGSSGSVTVTIISEVESNPPIGPEDLEVDVAQDKLAIIDISDRNFRDAVTGKVSWTYSAYSDVSVAVIAGV